MTSYPVFLIGFMGAGKTTLGQAVAQRLKWQFLDLDHWIVAQTGKSVKQIFADEGERAFRQMEKEAIDTLAGTSGTPSIIATGGGAPCFDDHLLRMKAAGKVIYLRPSVSELF
ncbi:MAG: shikimate kinase, partial [Bacteroidota bacterium]